MAMLADLVWGAGHYRCNSLLVDHRKSRMNFTFMTTFKRPDVYAGLGFSRDTKAALVWNKLVKDFLFFENVCVNRGFNVKVFDNHEAALCWLVYDARCPG